MTTQQGLKQQTVRDATGTTSTYEGDWNALFDAADIAAGTTNERMLLYINEILQTTYTNINDALAAAAAACGAPSWSEAGDISAILTTLSITYATLAFDTGDEPYTVTGAEKVSVADSNDDGSGIYEISLILSDGDITLAQTTGLTFSVGDGTADGQMTFEGTISNINSALDGMSLNNVSVGDVTLTIPFGNTTGGLIISRVIDITVTASPDTEITSLFAASELGVWYDPSDFTTMYQTNDTSTPVTAVGQSVGYIADKSGNANHATQSDAAKRPVLQQDGNGKYYLQFDGTNDCLKTAAIDFSGGDAMFMLVGAEKQDDTARVVFEHTAVITTAGAFNLLSGLDTSQNGWHFGAKGTTLRQWRVYPHTLVDKAVISGNFDISGDTGTGRRNATAFTTSNVADFGTGNIANDVLNIGSRNNGASARFNGKLYGLVLRNVATTGTPLTDAETWMNGKTGAY